MKKEKIILCGKSGSGKDYLQRQLKLKDLKFEPKITTRPKRTNEIDGVDYLFKSNDQFFEMLKNDLILCYQSFSVNNETWHYAISKSNFENNQIFIMTPAEVNQIPAIERKNCFVVYLDIDEEIRRQRVLRREDMNDSVNRRFEADRIDFENFRDYDMRITDAEFETDTIYDLMA